MGLSLLNLLLPVRVPLSLLFIPLCILFSFPLISLPFSFPSPFPSLHFLFLLSSPGVHAVTRLRGYLHPPPFPRMEERAGERPPGGGLSGPRPRRCPAVRAQGGAEPPRRGGRPARRRPGRAHRRPLLQAARGDGIAPPPTRAAAAAGERSGRDADLPEPPPPPPPAPRPAAWPGAKRRPPPACASCSCCCSAAGVSSPPPPRSPRRHRSSAGACGAPAAASASAPRCAACIWCWRASPPCPPKPPSCEYPGGGCRAGGPAGRERGGGRAEEEEGIPGVGGTLAGGGVSAFCLRSGEGGWTRAGGSARASPWLLTGLVGEQRLSVCPLVTEELHQQRGGARGCPRLDGAGLGWARLAAPQPRYPLGPAAGPGEWRCPGRPCPALAARGAGGVWPVPRVLRGWLEVDILVNLRILYLEFNRP